jgi:hypothetical protein
MSIAGYFRAGTPEVRIVRERGEQIGVEFTGPVLAGEKTPKERLIQGFQSGRRSSERVVNATSITRALRAMIRSCGRIADYERGDPVPTLVPFPGGLCASASNQSFQLTGWPEFTDLTFAQASSSS